MRLSAANVRKNMMSKRERAISAPPVKRKRERAMTEVKFVYTGYINIEGTDNSMDTIGEAIEIVRADYGSQVADYAEFTIEGESNE
jgi:hypothetical protein